MKATLNFGLFLFNEISIAMPSCNKSTRGSLHYPLLLGPISSRHGNNSLLLHVLAQCSISTIRSIEWQYFVYNTILINYLASIYHPMIPIIHSLLRRFIDWRVILKLICNERIVSPCLRSFYALACLHRTTSCFIGEVDLCAATTPSTTSAPWVGDVGNSSSSWLYSPNSSLSYVVFRMKIWMKFPTLCFPMAAQLAIVAIFFGAIVCTTWHSRFLPMPLISPLFW